MILTRDDIVTILQNLLPYYERDDADDYVYIARYEDLKRAADRIVEVESEL